MRPRPRFVLLLAMAVVAIAAPTVAAAKPTPAASASSGNGRVEADARAAVKRGDLTGAASQIRSARELDANVPASVVLLHAQIYAKLNDRSRATRAYQDFLRIAGTNASNKERGEAVARIQDFSSEVGALLVKVRPQGARVLVDGEFVGTAPLTQTVPVAPGTHVVSLQGSNVKKTVKVKSEESLVVELEGPAVAVAVAQPSPAVAAAPAPVPPAPAPPAPAPPPISPTTRPDLDVPPTENALGADDEKPKRKPVEATPVEEPASSPRENGRRSSAWMGWTAASALAAGAIVSGIVSNSAVGSYESKKETLGTTRDELESEQGRAKLFAGVSVGLGAAAVTVAAITFFTSRSKESGSSVSAPSASLRVSPGFVGVGGTFR